MPLPRGVVIAGVVILGLLGLAVPVGILVSLFGSPKAAEVLKTTDRANSQESEEVPEEFQKYVGYSIRDLVHEHGVPNLRLPGVACYLDRAHGDKPHVYVLYDPSGVWGPISEVFLGDDKSVEKNFGYRVPRFKGKK